jgi:hypothetical protein
MSNVRAQFRGGSSVLRRFERRGGVLKGCLIAAAVVVVILIALGVWVAMSWKGWTADIMKSATQAAVQNSQLPADQKTRITTRINSLADDFKDGKVTFEQLTQVLEQVASGPLMPLGIVYAAEEKYLKPSSLTAEEKDAGRRSMQRLARGVFEKKINKAGLDRAITPISVVGTGGEPRFKEQVTTEELKQFLAMAKEEADKAQIPDEPFTVNVADEVDKAIDKVLAKPTGGT